MIWNVGSTRWKNFTQFSFSTKEKGQLLTNIARASSSLRSLFSSGVFHVDWCYFQKIWSGKMKQWNSAAVIMMNHRHLLILLEVDSPDWVIGFCTRGSLSDTRTVRSFDDRISFALLHTMISEYASTFHLDAQLTWIHRICSGVTANSFS